MRLTVCRRRQARYRATHVGSDPEQMPERDPRAREWQRTDDDRPAHLEIPADREAGSEDPAAWPDPSLERGRGNRRWATSLDGQLRRHLRHEALCNVGALRVNYDEHNRRLTDIQNRVTFCPSHVHALRA